MFRHLFIALIAALSFSAFAGVDANKASQAELESVKGIGPGLSGKILEARKAGAFKSWDDMIERVPGIGTGNAARYSQAGLTVNEGAFAGASKAESKGEKPAKAAKADKAEKAEKSAAAAKP